jgi:TPR repeat protein
MKIIEIINVLPGRDFPQRKKGALMPMVSVSLTLAILIYSLLFIPVKAEACGWWGDGDDEQETVLVDSDGKPILDEEPTNDDSPAALTQLGNRYRKGDGVSKNYAKALRIYRKAAEKNFPGALNNIAVMYEEGLGVEKDGVEAAKWYRLAAEQGDGYAQHSLGRMYRLGQGVTMDLSGAFSDMGSLYWEGLGVPGNDVLAYMWWKIGATRGDEKSAKLCDMAARKMTPVKVDKAKKMAQDWTPKKD